jgi:hypothetical protein
MLDRLIIAVLASVLGVLIGLLSPSLVPLGNEARQAQQAWLNPPTRTPSPTSLSLTVVRPVVGQTAVPPTLTVPPPPPTATPEPTPSVRSFVIPLKDGGEMNVNATDRAAAVNNVKSSGATPAEP